tara:strand:+ start:6984 stop:7370 length:387 start_codon:yes stop_codon:yes gene_type:complete
MKNNEWIDLPVWQTELYPKKIRDIAKKVGAEVEQIAKNEGITPGVILWEWIKREDIMEIFRIIEYPENTKMSIILLLSGEQMIVDMPHRKLMARIHKFLLTEPQYDFEQEGSEPVQIVEISGEHNEEE